MTIFLRPFQTSDWTAICQIHDLARPDELRGSCDPRAFVPIEKDPEVADLRSCQKMVAVEDNRVVGFVGTQETYLGWLYVHPDYYSRGIGRKLLQAGAEQIGGKAWTIVLAGNTRARDLYNSEGFKEVLRFESDNAGYPCTCIRLESEDGP